MKKLVFMLAILLMAPAAGAEELRELYRGARAQAMGNAFTAVADDEEAIYLNPAGMAGQKRATISVNEDAEISSDVIAAGTGSAADAFSNFSPASLNGLMGKDIYLRSQFTPSFVMPHFGASILLDDQFAVLSKNQALPQITLGYQQTNGIQVAYGASITPKFKRKRHDIRIGIGAKMLWRRGGYALLSQSQLMSVSQNTLSQIAGNFQQGYGVDLGTQYLYEANKRLTLSWGMAMTEIGNVEFGPGTDDQKGNLSTGFAATYKVRKISATFAYDIRHILETTDWRKRNHFGIEFALPIVSLQGGINQTYLTYGASVDLYLFKVGFVSYAEEIGTLAFQDPERRYLLHLSANFGL